MMLKAAEVTVQDVRIRTEDGWDLAGTLYRAEAPTLAILISAGTGFPRRFYRHAAAYFAARGATVLTYDYRGIGESKPEDLAGSGIDYPHWGQRDMSAALAYLAAAAPGAWLTTLGHSIGGQLVGFAKPELQVSRHAFVAVGSGFWGVHKLRNLPMEWFFWWLYGPLCLARYGYIPAGGLWGGEALPPELFKTWRRWSGRRSYLLPDLESGRYMHHFDAVEGPICAWVLSDDPIATKTACEDTLSHYPQAQKHLVVRQPQDLAQRKVGHEGAFRKGHEALWQELWAWLSEGDLPQGGGGR
ncbi:Predicted alpha/beta hydrolase [Shimia marina]|uniref:Alpha/beta hydrolase family protein n=2 Tax=Shimia marina TaxID=321267 RepID=A0A0P1EQE5_9RHOB|nr:Alpha/beta hydrolase family protein [Shimia marina]SFE09168.1 Predicted alpha/beta hydrolase [Shimia marina]